jgi:hypothetical protein
MDLTKNDHRLSKAYDLYSVQGLVKSQCDRDHGETLASRQSKNQHIHMIVGNQGKLK